MAAWKRRWPLGRGFERFYGFLGGESSCWYPDLIHDNHPIEPPATPDEGYHIAKDLSDKAIRFIRDAKVVEPDKPFFLYFSLDAAHAPHHVFKEWADKYKGTFDDGYEAIRDEHPRPAEGARAAARRHRAVAASTRTASRAPPGPDGQPWPMLDTVRPWESLSDDEKRLFIRMAEVFAGYVEYTDDQVGRVIDFLESSPASSTTRSSSSSPTTARAARAARTARSTSGGSSTACPTPTELTLRAHRRARQPGVVQPLQHRVGLGVRHPVPVLEAVGRLRGRHRRHVPGRPGPRRSPPTSTPRVAVRPRGRRRARRSTT